MRVWTGFGGENVTFKQRETRRMQSPMISSVAGSLNRGHPRPHNLQYLGTFRENMKDGSGQHTGSTGDASHRMRQGPSRQS